MKKKKKSKRNTKVFFENERALRELSKMKHRDIQRACIVRGMPSAEMVNSDHHKLVSWFIKNFERSQDESLLVPHDLWVEEQLKLKGYKEGDTLMSPALRFSYVKDFEQIEKPKVIKPNQPIVIPEKKVKAEIDKKTGVREGTKKAMTYGLTDEKLAIDKIIKAVKKKFPNAEEKSIKIWYKRRLKELQV